MSRKSLPKKDAIVWYLCAKCNAYVHVKDREEHSEHCPVIESTTCAAIRDKILVSARLSIQPMTEELRALNARHLTNLVFIHESVFGLCEFVLGDYVLISSPALPNGIPIVRMAWPSSNSSMVPTAIGVTDEGDSTLNFFICGKHHIYHSFDSQNSGGPGTNAKILLFRYKNFHWI